ncbi:hypothetical protein Tco_1201946 [Tanacetum coccineum]
MMVQNQSQLGEGLAILTDPHHTPTFIQPSPQPQKTQQPRKPKRKDTQVPQPSDPIENVVDEAIHKELGDSLVRAASLRAVYLEEETRVLGENPTTTISSQLSSQQSQEKGKGILIEPVKPMNKKNQIRLDEETALNLQAEFDEEERLAREKAKKEEEANIALIETWDDI